MKMAILLLTPVVMLIGAVTPAVADGQFIDDFSTDMWTDFSTDGTYDIYVDTSAEVFRFNSECLDRDFSYKLIEPALNVTVQFKINITFTQNTGRVFIGLSNAADNFWRQAGGVFVTNVTEALVLVVQGPHNTPNGINRMYSMYKRGNTSQVDDINVGYDFALNTEYFVNITKQGGRGIVELWDATKTVMHFRKDWGDVNLQPMRYLLVSDPYYDGISGHGCTGSDRVYGYIDNLSSVWSVSVGGLWIPINKLELLAPYIGLTILLAVAVITVGYVKKRKRHARISS